MTDSPALHALSTERMGGDFQHIDTLSTSELVTLMNQQDAQVATAVGHAVPAIAAAIDAIVERMRQGGRIVYLGAGTSGRLGVLDAAECGPTFNAADLVLAVIAGGPSAVTQAAEGAEDDRVAAQADLIAVGLRPGDVVVGITASGRTPYVCAGVTYAAGIGALTVGIACNSHTELGRLVHHAIEVDTGAEVIAGSTRLKAATAQKMVLNMISSVSMVRLGKTFGNMMADLRISNEKLRLRGIRIVAEATGVDEARAAATLEACGFDVRRAVEHLRATADGQRLPSTAS